MAYRRYLTAERAWTEALREARSWFPRESRPGRTTIGTPGSRLRRSYEQRQRAILLLEAARQKLEVARLRLSARERATQARPLRLIEVSRIRKV